MMDLICPLGICGFMSEIQAQKSRVKLGGIVLGLVCTRPGLQSRGRKQSTFVPASGASARVERHESAACRQPALSAFQYKESCISGLENRAYFYKGIDRLIQIPFLLQLTLYPWALCPWIQPTLNQKYWWGSQAQIGGTLLYPSSGDRGIRLQV